MMTVQGLASEGWGKGEGVEARAQGSWSLFLIQNLLRVHYFVSRPHQYVSVCLSGPGLGIK